MTDNEKRGRDPRSVDQAKAAAKAAEATKELSEKELGAVTGGSFGVTNTGTGGSNLGSGGGRHD